MHGYAHIFIPAFDPVFHLDFSRPTRKVVREKIDALGMQTEGLREVLQGIPLDALEDARAIVAEAYPEWTIQVVDRRPVRRNPEDALAWGPKANVGWSRTDTHTGYAGKIPLFSVERTRESVKRFVVSTNLPPVGLGPNREYADTIPEAERIAERMLHRFVHAIGAKFINE